MVDEVLQSSESLLARHRRLNVRRSPGSFTPLDLEVGRARAPARRTQRLAEAYEESPIIDSPWSSFGLVALVYEF